MTIVALVRAIHAGFFTGVERLAGGWFLGLAARFTFLAVLFFYFFNSWMTKAGDGLLGFLLVKDNAYYQIVPWAVDAAGGEIDQIGFINDLVVHAGALAELVLPVLVVLGLFTRVAAAGMIVFVAVQSWVDVAFHGVDAQTTGAWFDRFSDSLIADQRLLWGFVLIYLVVKGAGALSLDALLWRLTADRP